MHHARIGAVLFALFTIVACRPPPTEPQVAATSTLAAATYRPPMIRLAHRGTNLSGAEFGSNVPGTHGRDYVWPTSKDVDYFVDRGMNHFRVPFRHERLQREVKTALDEDEWKRLSDLVTYATNRGASVAIEPHNSARHKGRIITETEMGDFWGRVAVRLKSNPRVMLNLTNEPHDIKTEQWVLLANAAIREIRRVGFTGLVLVPGNGFTGGGHWTAKWYGTPNSVAMLNVKDPGNNMAFEVHQYLDDNADGGGECLSPTIGIERLEPFVAWLRTHGHRGFLGEVGAPDTPACRESIARTLAYVEAHYDVWMGWAWWSAGPWWKNTRYPLSLSPYDDAKERPQLDWLRAFLPCARRVDPG